MLSKEQRDIIRARDKARTQGEWRACDDGKCRCKQIWTDNHPVATVECGEWGDEYPALRLEGEALNRKAVAYMDLIPYGTIDEQVAHANVAFIAASSADIPNLLDTCDELERALEGFYNKLLNYECIVKSTDQRVRHKNGCFYCGLVDEMEATLTRLTAKPSEV